MTTRASKEAIAALRGYLEAESARDLARTLELVDAAHCGFGTGPDEIVRDREELRAILGRQFAQTSNVVSHAVEILSCLEVSPDACLIMAVITFQVEIGGAIEKLAPRFSFLMRRGGDRAWRLLHLHASIPWSLQQEGESFPLQEVEERNRRLERLVAERTQALNQTLELLQKLATTDKLTGIHNRAKLDELIADEHRMLQRFARASSIAILDIDHFKDINDTHGHLVGDRVLQELAAVLGGSVRGIDRLGRWGGEEFLILLPEASAANARSVLERLRERLRAHDFRLSLPVTLSAGIAQYRPGESVDAWISRADEMLYQAKHAGRNRILTDG
jgi:diguanylate cyclase (GGDEF)-like protein